MKLSNTSLIKGLSVEASIVAAINEMFNARASAEYVDCLVVDGLVGVCVQTEEKCTRSYTYTSTSYFIATQVIGTDFVRVDYCGDSEMIWDK
tara:strand:+ start:145 stop:420 length:276 start_codon:yes stop_codon:yes gene_type:complete